MDFARRQNFHDAASSPMRGVHDMGAHRGKRTGQGGERGSGDFVGGSCRLAISVHHRPSHIVV